MKIRLKDIPNDHGWTCKGTDDGSVVVYQADCLDVLPTLSGVDAVVTDPVWPNVPDGMFDMEVTPQSLFTAATYRLPECVKRLAVHLGCNSDPRFLTAVPPKFAFFRACWLEYVRPGYLGRLLYTSDMAYLFGEPPASRKGNAVISGYCQLVDSNRERVDHPCIRQLPHVEWLANKWTTEGESVLDPFMGSGTTGVACVRTGRRFIGIEKEPKYFDIAVGRIEDELNRAPLFQEAKPVQATFLEARS